MKIRYYKSYRKASSLDSGIAKGYDVTELKDFFYLYRFLCLSALIIEFIYFYSSRKLFISI